MPQFKKSICLLLLIDTILLLGTTLVIANVYNIALSISLLPAIIFTLVSIYIFYLKSYYTVRKYNFFFKETYFLFEGLLLSYLITFAIMFFIGIDKSIFHLLITTLFASFIVLYTWRASSYEVIKRLPAKNVLIAGANEMGKNILLKIKKRDEYNINVVGFIDNNTPINSEIDGVKVIGKYSDIEKVAKKSNIKIIIKTDKELNLEGKTSFKQVQTAIIYEKLAKKIPIKFITDDWFIKNFGSLKRPIYNFLNRIFDIIAATIILLVTLPFEIIIALSIKFADGGPIFYYQERVGKDGKPFNMIKLRTMIEKAEENGAVWAADNNKDPRVTPIGRIARKIRFDEIPQMINIIKGEMSVVGPRPERPEFVELLEKEVPFYAKRHLVKPGWTGWAQIMYRYGASIDDAAEKLRYDLFYIKNGNNIIWNLSILLKAVGMALTGRHG